MPVAPAGLTVLGGVGRAGSRKISQEKDVAVVPFCNPRALWFYSSLGKP